ncbi:MAG: DegV family protein [Anaerolineales bacterium]
MTIRIVTDSTCDLPQSVIDELGIKVVPLYITIGQKSFQDGVEISRKEFYTNLPAYSNHPTTATPSVDVLTRTYQSLVDDGATEILSIHISISLSATVDVARTAAVEFQNVPVTVWDSRQLSLGTGFQVETAARMAMEGKSMMEILEVLEDMAARSFVAARLSTLEFLRRSGRMNSAMTGIGSLLRLKPILKMIDGKPTSERVRTFKKAEGRLIQLLKERLPVERFALLHTNASQDAQGLLERLAEVFPVNPVYSMDITPVIGAHIGPGAIGFAIISKK